LDITHYSSLTKEQELAIENAANTLVLKNLPIQKYFVDKATAEKEDGFSLYQGGKFKYKIPISSCS
jgi:alanyl-tRNA synthetase